MNDIFDGDRRLTDPLTRAQSEWTTVASLVDPDDELGRTGPNLALLLICVVVIGVGLLASVVLIQAYMNLVAWEPMIAERCGVAPQ